MAKIRLFINTSLTQNDQLTLDEKKSHYLTNVMKQKSGDTILCFNGKDGEFLCEIIEPHKKHCQISVLKQTQKIFASPDLWLLFAPLKKDNTDFVIEKATELGISRIIPTITKHTNSEKVRIDRLQAQSIEAAEQSRRLDIPKIIEATPLEKLLENWDISRTLYYMDETHNGNNLYQTFIKAQTPAAILIGPEGGFDEKELKLLRKLSYTIPVDMGTRILRAETAAIAAISCWQAICGDWR